MKPKFADFGFYHVNTAYLKYLHDEIDTEVYYSEVKNYERKPFLGVIVNIEDYQYFIPLTSRKTKHLKWKNVGNTHYLIYETVDKKELRRGDIFKPVPDSDTVLKLLSALDIKKMIPVPADCYEKVDFNAETDLRYKALLEKEYFFCQSVQDGILEKALKIYHEQKESGVVHKMYCNFSKLEEACKTWNPA